jgi:hypothetical protein
MARMIVGVAVALVVAGSAAAAPADTYTLNATLAARFEVPRPSGVPTGATGRFTGRAIELRNGRTRLMWRLTLARLSGRAMAAHLHSGRTGRAGPVLVPLCGPCRSGQRGTATLTGTQLATIRAGRVYANVHTARNAGGEIRGQVKAKRAPAGSEPGAAPPPPTDPEPPPYPPYP